MMLYLRGTDIHRLILGSIASDRSRFIVSPQTHDVSPEKWLGIIDEFLSSNLSACTGIVLVLGPGSATALRTSLVLANAIAFTRSLPMFGFELPLDADDRMALILLHEARSLPIARPIYSASAHITPQKKDTLHRR